MLSGSGSVGNITVQSGGIVAPGCTGAGTLAAANLTLQSGGILNYTLGAAASNSGFLNVSGGVVTLPSSGGIINVADAGGLDAGTYPIISYGTLSGGAPSTAFGTVNLPSGLIAEGDTYSFITTGSAIDLVIAGVVNGQWATNGPGTWSTAANWTGGVPGAGVDTALLGTALTSGSAAVALDSNRNLSSLAFNTTGGASYTISGTNTLTLANPGGSATLSDSGGNHTIAVPLVIGSNLNVSVTAGSTLTVTGPFSEGGSGRSLTVGGGGELILSGTNVNYSGATTVSAGTLQVGDSFTGATSGLSIAAGATFQLNSAAFWQPPAISGTSFAISGSGTFLKTGPGIMSLANTTNNGGVMTISMGAGGLIDIEGGAIADNATSVQWISNLASMNIASGALFDIRAQSAVIDALTGSGTVANTFDFNNPNVLTIGVANGSGTFSGTIMGNGAPEGIYGMYGLTAVGNLNSGITCVTKIGTGIEVLSGSNVYTGYTQVNVGTLQIGNGGGGEYLASPTIGVSGGATLAFNLADTLTYSGTIGGGGQLVKQGGGLLALTGNNTYSGQTSVNGGALAVNGTLNGSGAVAVNGGGLLSGSGSVGNVTVISGGTLAPGYMPAPEP